MPRIRRKGLPAALYRHLLMRVSEREITVTQLQLFADWMSLETEVPVGKWFKRFSQMTVCGKGEFIKTFLRPGQVATGEEVF